MNAPTLHAIRNIEVQKPLPRGNCTLVFQVWSYVVVACAICIAAPYRDMCFDDGVRPAIHHVTNRKIVHLVNRRADSLIVSPIKAILMRCVTLHDFDDKHATIDVLDFVNLKPTKNRIGVRSDD